MVHPPEAEAPTVGGNRLFSRLLPWMARMQSCYEVRRTEWVELDLSGASSGPRRERWLIIDFVPKPDRQPAEIAGRPKSAASG